MTNARPPGPVGNGELQRALVRALPYIATSATLSVLVCTPGAVARPQCLLTNAHYWVSNGNEHGYSSQQSNDAGRARITANGPPIDPSAARLYVYLFLWHTQILILALLEPDCSQQYSEFFFATSSIPPGVWAPL